MTTKSRNVGIDLLRILAIFGVIILYINASGSKLGAGLSFGHFSLSWLVEVLLLPVLNVFVLIAGFVGYRSEKSYPKTKSILRMLFVALFYSVILCILFKIIHPTWIGGLAIVKAFLPFTSGQYWFLSAYLLLCLFMPVLNRFVSSVSNKNLFFVLLVFLSVFSVYGLFPSLFGDVLGLNDGVGALWFFVLYLLGAFIKKINLPQKFSRKNWLVLLGGCYLLTYLFVLIFGKLDVSIFSFSLTRFGYIFTSSLSPTILLAAISLVCLFSECRVSQKNMLWIKLVAPSVLPIYLFVANTYVLSGWFLPLFSPLAITHPILALLLTLLYAVCVFAVCFIVDMLRRILFNVICVEAAVDKIGTILQDVYARIAAFANEKLGL